MPQVNGASANLPKRVASRSGRSITTTRLGCCRQAGGRLPATAATPRKTSGGSTGSGRCRCSASRWPKSALRWEPLPMTWARCARSWKGNCCILGQHAEQVQAVQDRIRDLLSRIDGAAMPAPEQFMATLEMITMLENYFTPEQRQELAGRRAELGSDSIEAAKVRWAALVEEGLRHVENGTPVSDPSIREWATAWDEIGSMFHAGEETKAAARSMWQDNRTALSADLPWTPEQLAGLMAYLQKARTQP